MENSSNEHKNINGWGIDADPKNDPTYPMKKRTDEEHKGYSWERPPQQAIDVEVLHSNERPNVSAVFGTSTPPSGLSGAIRRYAFRYSEASFAHWIPLILADRINVVEGIIEDLQRGYVPNIFAERGWKAELKYNKENFLKKAIACGVISSLVIGALIYRKGHKSKKWI